MKQQLKALAVRIAIRLLASRYSLMPNASGEQAYKTAIHDLLHKNAKLHDEREAWKLRAIVNKHKASA